MLHFCEWRRQAAPDNKCGWKHGINMREEIHCSISESADLSDDIDSNATIVKVTLGEHHLALQWERHLSRHFVHTAAHRGVGDAGCHVILALRHVIQYNDHQKTGDFRSKCLNFDAEQEMHSLILEHSVLSHLQLATDVECK